MPQHNLGQVLTLLTGEEKSRVSLGGNKPGGLSRDWVYDTLKNRGGVTPRAARAAYEWIRLHGTDTLPDDTGEDGATDRVTMTVAEDSGTADLEIETRRPVKTLADLIRVAEIDEAVWDIVSWAATTWTTTIKARRTTIDEDGREHTTTIPKRVQNYRVTAKLRRKVFEASMEALRVAMVQAAREWAPTVRARPTPPPGDLAVVLNIYDLHIGKDAEGWDPDTAERTFLNAAEYLLGQYVGAPVAEVVIPIGHDMQHVDSTAGLTTHGTRVESNLGWREQFIRTQRCARSAVALALDVAPKVRLKMIWGNHDENSIFSHGVALSAAYENTPEVEVDNAPDALKFHLFGANGFMLTHGKDIRFENLPITFALSRPDIWAASKWREIHTGHLHKRGQRNIGEVHEVGGCILRISPALCPADEWHKRLGFIGAVRGAEAFAYVRDGGLYSTYGFVV